VDALDQPLGRELAQVAAHGVLGHAELGDEVGRDELAVPRETAEHGLAAFGGEHPCRL
jgi:hypothetical protein